MMYSGGREDSRHPYPVRIRRNRARSIGGRSLFARGGGLCLWCGWWMGAGAGGHRCQLAGRVDILSRFVDLFWRESVNISTESIINHS